MQISFMVTAKLISAFVFATRIVQSLFFLNPKFQASSHPLWLYSPVCVGPGRKPRRPVFSQRGSYYLLSHLTSDGIMSSKLYCTVFLPNRSYIQGSQINETKLPKFVIDDCPMNSVTQSEQNYKAFASGGIQTSKVLFGKVARHCISSSNYSEYGYR